MTRTRNKIIGCALGVMLAALSVAACGDDGGPDAAGSGRGFVGTVDGTDAFISIGVGAGDSAETLVYVCNGDEEIAAWFSVADDSASFTVTNASGEAVTAQLVDGAYRGEYTEADGTVHAFTTEPITGEGGVYRTGDDAAAQNLVAIWVIDNGGDERGAILSSGVFQTTTRFSPTFAFGGSTFVVTKYIGMNGIISPNN